MRRFTATANFPRHRRTRAACLLLAVLMTFVRTGAGRDIVVAQDGSGDYTTVQAAIMAVPDYDPARSTIRVRPGIYREKLVVPKQKRHVTLVGDDRDTTILTYDDFAPIYADGSIGDTFATPSVYIRGKDFGARNLTFSNTAGDASNGVGPAIAVTVRGNHAHFRNCSFLGRQDTLYTTARETYFKRCFIEGQTDFIFGSSTAVFHRCRIHCLGHGYVTAANTPPDQKYGLIFKGCSIYGEAPTGSVYLGRAWGTYARVVYLNCVMDDEIAPEGWDDFQDPAKRETAFFAEGDSSGDGADADDRADWSYQVAEDETADYSLRRIFGLPSAPLYSMIALGTEALWYSSY